jgi:hypothetical protein
MCLHVADFQPRRDHKTRRRKPWTVDQVMTTYTAAVTSLLKPPPQSPSSNNHRVIKQLVLSFHLTDAYVGFIGHAVGDVVEHCWGYPKNWIRSPNT